MPDSMPEKTIELFNSDGSVRIRLIAQMWKIEQNGERKTYCTSAIFGPVEMTDDDARWLAEQQVMLFRSMDLYK